MVPRKSNKFQYPKTVPSAFFLVGPTAVGKSAVAQFLAEQDNMQILSADSMLVYKGMDIGTAKPSAEERKKASYWGLDLVNPGEPCSVGTYLAHAAGAFASAPEKRNETIVVGGTGLYIKCLIEGLDPLPSADPSIREAAERILKTQGIEALQEMLRAKDFLRYDLLKDKKNPRRLIRALELAMHNVPIKKSWSGQPDKPLAGLKMQADALYERIRKRVVYMFESGLLDEVRQIRQSVASLSDSAFQAIGYAEALAVLDDRLTLKEAVEQTVKRTKTLARRQMTWFRGQAHVEWVDADPDEPIEVLAEKVRNLWSKYGPVPVHIR